MLVNNGRSIHVYDEVRREDQPLGRHLEKDARSLAYAVEQAWPAPAPPIKPAEHKPSIPTLDQGHLHEQKIDEPGSPEALGSCTGNGGAYALSALLSGLGLQNAHLKGLGLSPTDTAANEKFAIELYSEACLADGLPDLPWPPNDRGSTGLGVCKALKRAGLIGGYNWATSVRGLGALLQRQGVIMGTPWFASWFQPDAQGFVDSAKDWGPVVGGHEIFCEALEAWDDRDPSKCVIRFHNSWGSAWGDHGCGRMRLSTYVKNSTQVDVKQLVAKHA